MFDLKNWVDWCAVLGAALSIIQFMATILKSRVRISVSNAEFYPFSETSKGRYFFIRMVLTNMSSVPVGISQVTVIFPGGTEIRALRGEQIIMSTKLRTRKGTYCSEIENTHLPVNLTSERESTG